MLTSYVFDIGGALLQIEIDQYCATSQIKLVKLGIDLQRLEVVILEKDNYNQYYHQQFFHKNSYNYRAYLTARPDILNFFRFLLIHVNRFAG